MNEQLLLMCSHFAPYMCSQCAKCSRCCTCKDKPLPPIKSTMSRESQEKLREVRRAMQDELRHELLPPGRESGKANEGVS